MKKFLVILSYLPIAGLAQHTLPTDKPVAAGSLFKQVEDSIKANINRQAHRRSGVWHSRPRCIFSVRIRNDLSNIL